ncbi:MAG: precorrin-8X methylmutase [Prochlorococcus sp.]
MPADHPIFSESIRRIRERLGETGLDPLQEQVLQRLIHSSGDLGLAPQLRFSPAACDLGLAALKAGARILTDTAMAAAAVGPMAQRTLQTEVDTFLAWAPQQAPAGCTRAALGLEAAWLDLAVDLNQAVNCHHAVSCDRPVDTARQPAPVVLIGSAPTALEALIDLVADGAPAPSLVIGMPVGFVGVAESKRRLAASGLTQIRLEGSRGGAGLVAAAANALLRAAAMA